MKQLTKNNSNFSNEEQYKNITAKTTANSALFQAIDTLEALQLRKKILHTLYAAGGGHYGGTLSVADILLTLYKYFIHCGSSQRNRLILSKGHAAVTLYCVLAQLGYLDEFSLINYGQLDAALEGHPDMLATPNLDFSSGSLGQGLSVGLGMALGLQAIGKHVWIILGDGECQEGQVWEAALLAARYKVYNLHIVIDANGAQEFGYQYNKNLPQMPVTNFHEKWEAFGWNVTTVDGHDHQALKAAFNHCIAEQHLPSAVIANTKKGYGVSLFEQNPEQFHCATLTLEQHHQALQEVQNHAT